MVGLAWQEDNWEKQQWGVLGIRTTRGQGTGGKGDGDSSNTRKRVRK